LQALSGPFPTQHRIRKALHRHVHFTADGIISLIAGGSKGNPSLHASESRLAVPLFCEVQQREPHPSCAQQLGANSLAPMAWVHDEEELTRMQGSSNTVRGIHEQASELAVIVIPPQDAHRVSSSVR
jgi:hypothetical protein